MAKRLVAMVLAVLAVYLLASSPPGKFLLRIEAVNVSLLLNLLGVPHIRVGRLILVVGDGAYGFLIEPHCCGFVTFSMYVAAVLVLCRRLRRLPLHLAVGFSSIYLANVARVLAIVYLYHAYGPEASTLFHVYIAPMILLAVLVALIASAARVELAY